MMANNDTLLATRKRVHLILNDYKDQREIHSFQTEANLVAHLFESVAAGKRVFVATNSKKHANAIAASLRVELKVRTYVVTSDNSASIAVDHFIKNIATESLKYDVVLCSPSLGTGVDIAFPNNATKFDEVFGLFYPLINTHFDIDQQLARVRHPGAVKVWVSDARFQFDTGREVIKRELQKREAYTDLLLDYDERLEPVYHTDDPFIDMAALAVTQERASKNDMRRNFLDLKRQQGFEVIKHAWSEDAEAVGEETIKVGLAIVKQARVSGILDASPLTKPQLEELKEKAILREHIALSDRFAMERTFIEIFYRRKPDFILIDADRGGKERDAIKNLEGVISYWKIAQEQPGVLQSWDNMTPENCPELRFVKDLRKKSGLLYHLLRVAGALDEHCKWQLAKTFWSAELKIFGEELLRLKPIVETTLGINVRMDVVKKPVRMLSDLLQQVGLALVENGSVTRAGQKAYKYELDVDALIFVQEIIEMRKATKGWSYLYEAYGWDKREIEDDQ